MKKQKSLIDMALNDSDQLKKYLSKLDLNDEDKERIAAVIGLACIPTEEESNLTLRDVARRLRKMAVKTTSEKRKKAYLKVAEWLEKAEPEN